MGNDHAREGTMQRRATLKDIARAAGVHLSTVSRALNPLTRNLLTSEVVDRISKISRELDYSPNAAARSLRTNRTRTIGIVVPDITNPVFPPIIRGIEDAVAERGYLAIVANTDSRLNKEAEIAHLLHARGVDGLVLASVERVDDAVSRLSAEGLPIVTVNRRVDDPAVSSVVNQEDAGIREVLRHLASLGHRAIAHLAGPQAMSTGVERYRAFETHRAALALDWILLSSPSPRPSMRTKVPRGRKSSSTVAPVSPPSCAPTTAWRSGRSPRFAGMGWIVHATFP